MWDNKRFRSLNFALKEEFGEKIYKVSLDAGLTCPNRDGKISTNGCIFCNETGSGDFAGDRKKSITEQIEQQLDLIKSKFPTGRVIAYFQNFTNTYGDINYLEKAYIEALSHERVVGIAIATRPDCIDEKVIKLLERLNKKTFLWIELGLQTIKAESAKFINRGYSLSCFEESLAMLNANEIKVVVHLIIGLYGETEKDIFNSVEYLSERKIWGIKLHLLHIIKGTQLHEFYKKNRFDIFTSVEYIDLICRIIACLNPEMVIHRLTGDGNKETLIAPLWSLDKRMVLNGISKKLKESELYQGKYFNLKVVEDKNCFAMEVSSDKKEI